MNLLTFNGQGFAEYNAQILRSDFLKGAERDVSSFSVLGRSGDLIADNGRFKNVSYNVMLGIKGDMKLNLDLMRSFLASCKGYCRYEESDSPDEYRMAEYHHMFTPDQYDHQNATIKLQFNMKPQRFLVSGESWTSFTANGTITNPTLQTALPVIRVYGTGSFTIGSVTVTIASNPYDYIDIDCDIMLPHYGALSAREYVTTTNHDYPELVPGDNGIQLDGVTLDIMPRWFEI